MTINLDQQVFMLLGYNTNGFAHHRLEDAISILADLGYLSIAITLDYYALNPYAPDLDRQIATVRRLLEARGLRCVIETGSRFVLDPWRKHWPTLISPEISMRRRRLDFLERAIDIAKAVGAEVVSFWSGAIENGQDAASSMAHLVAGCRHLCDFASQRNIKLAFEPEPGMLIDRMERFAQLDAQISHPFFGLTIDIGHLHCQNEAIADHLGRWHERMWNIHIEDMRRGVHDHLMFGEGEIDFSSVMSVLQEIGYAGGVHVELSRHSHDAIVSARKALTFLKSFGQQQT